MTIVEEKLKKFNEILEHSKLEFKQYQLDGIEWCLNNELRHDPPGNVRGGIIADEMGLGKTIMMIGLMYCNFVSRTLIVVPPILIDQWYLQIYKTTGHKPLIYHGEDKKNITIDDLNSSRIVIASYAAICCPVSKVNKNIKNSTLLHNIKWGRVIFDEAHHMRNNKTQRYVGAKLLNTKLRWLVSGTPVQNAKKDFYNLCSLIGIPATIYKDTENKDNANTLSNSFILKRTKKDVGIIISDICIEKNIVDWSSEKEKKMSEDIHSALSFSGVRLDKEYKSPLLNAILETSNEAAMLLFMLRAKQSCIYPKIFLKHLDKMANSTGIDLTMYKDIINHSSKLDAVINSILANKGNGNGKLVFCHFHEEMDEIAERLNEGGISTVVTFDGRTSERKKFDILNGTNEVLILQIQTGCEGLNLQENYNEIYFVSPHWNPAIEDQAIARCHRIGQTKTVYVKRFEMSSFVAKKDDVNTNNIDKYVEFKQNMKRAIVSEIFDSK